MPAAPLEAGRHGKQGPNSFPRMTEPVVADLGRVIVPAWKGARRHRHASPFLCITALSNCVAVTFPK